MKLIRNDFDSEFFGKSIAKLDLGAENSLPAILEIEQALVDGSWDMLAVCSKQALPALREYEVGQLLELSGSLLTMRSRLAATRSSHTVSTLSERDWPAVKALQVHASQTRFSADTHFDGQVVEAHKMAMLKQHQQGFPELSVKIESGGEPLLGFQVSTLKERTLDFYEVIVDPLRSSGFSTVSLFKTVVERAIDIEPECRSTSTRIYAGNRRALGFFDRMGMARVGLSYYYHIWAGVH